MHKSTLATVGVIAAAIASTAVAEPIGRWWSGFGQGNSEYGIKNDSAGADEIYIACGEVPTTVSFTVTGHHPKPGDTAYVTIGRDEFVLPLGRQGEFETVSHVAADNFQALWTSIRSGSAMRVRLSTGQSTGFTLKGAGAALPKTGGCTPDFAR